MATTTIKSTAKVKLSSSEEAVSKKVWMSIDDVNNEKITAYAMGHQIGKKKGAQAFLKEINKQFMENITTAKEASELLFRNLKKAEIHVDSIHLRLEPLNEFEGLIWISEGDYLSDAYAQATKMALDVVNKYKELSLIFTFMPFSDPSKINTKALFADGYDLSFGRQI